MTPTETYNQSVYSEPNTDDDEDLKNSLESHLDTQALIDSVDEPEAKPVRDTIANVAAYGLALLD